MPLGDCSSTPAHNLGNSDLNLEIMSSASVSERLPQDDTTLEVKRQHTAAFPHVFHSCLYTTQTP